MSRFKPVLRPPMYSPSRSQSALTFAGSCIVSGKFLALVFNREIHPRMTRTTRVDRSRWSLGDDDDSASNESSMRHPRGWERFASLHTCSSNNHRRRTDTHGGGDSWMWPAIVVGGIERGGWLFYSRCVSRRSKAADVRHKSNHRRTLLPPLSLSLPAAKPSSCVQHGHRPRGLGNTPPCELDIDNNNADDVDISCGTC